MELENNWLFAPQTPRANMNMRKKKDGAREVVQIYFDSRELVFLPTIKIPDASSGSKSVHIKT